MKAFFSAAVLSILAMQANAATLMYGEDSRSAYVYFRATGEGWQVFDIPLNILNNRKVTIAAFYYDKVVTPGIRSITIDVDDKTIMTSDNSTNIWQQWVRFQDRDPISNIMRVAFDDQGGGRGMVIRMNTPVPLPASVALLPFGLGALALLRRRRRTAV